MTRVTEKKAGPKEVPTIPTAPERLFAIPPAAVPKKESDIQKVLDFLFQSVGDTTRDAYPLVFGLKGRPEFDVYLVRAAGAAQWSDESISHALESNWRGDEATHWKCGPRIAKALWSVWNDELRLVNALSKHYTSNDAKVVYALLGVWSKDMLYKFLQPLNWGSERIDNAVADANKLSLKVSKDEAIAAFASLAPQQ